MPVTRRQRRNATTQQNSTSRTNHNNEVPQHVMDPAEEPSPAVQPPTEVPQVEALNCAAHQAVRPDHEPGLDTRIAATVHEPSPGNHTQSVRNQVEALNCAANETASAEGEPTWEEFIAWRASMRAKQLQMQGNSEQQHSLTTSSTSTMPWGTPDASAFFRYINAAPKFDGTNWALYSSTFEVQAGCFNLHPFLSPSPPAGKGYTCPDKDVEPVAYASFHRYALAVFNALLQTCHDLVRISLLKFAKSDNPAAEAWTYLQSKYCVENGREALYLRDELRQQRLLPGKAESYILKIKTIREQLEAVQSPVTDIDLKNALHSGIPEDDANWKTFKTIMRLNLPELTIDDLCHRILAEDKEAVRRPQREEEVLALQTYYAGKNKAVEESNKPTPKMEAGPSGPTSGGNKPGTSCSKT